MFFLLVDAAVELRLQCSVLVLTGFQLLVALLHISTGDLLNVLQVMQKHFFSLLVLGTFVGRAYLLQVVGLLVEKCFGVLHCVEQVEVLPVLVRLEIQTVEQLY